MNSAPIDIDIEDQGGGCYLVTVPSVEGPRRLTLALSSDDDGSGGLAQDANTAMATTRYLLTHQDAMDLPDWIDLDTVLAAYPDAVKAIRQLLR